MVQTIALQKCQDFELFYSVNRALVTLQPSKTKLRKKLSEKIKNHNNHSDSSATLRKTSSAEQFSIILKAKLISKMADLHFLTLKVSNLPISPLCGL